ncbi:YbfB/YjiJ family MFS transporter [Enterobacteriaceae bacterium 8376wB8]|nr:YbfB/YjiJ family MFS transporter [Enterobacteriaceae bacterium 8376wD9]MVY24490.1 YbfB/YjiJ family MFS transporter [Enterobacteriaceae bacterium 8376wB8]
MNNRSRQAIWLALAGSIVLMIGMGYGRFAFTGVLPLMLNEGLLTLHQGNLAASANYAGYLVGALLLARVQPGAASRLSIISAGLTIASLALLAWVSSPCSLQSVDPVHLWALFGLAAAPSCLIWHKLVLTWGYRQALTRNLIVQALGVILPACSASLLFCVLSALLVGFTFMGTVTIALPKAKSLSHQVSFNMIAAMTALYGVGQIAGPLIAGALYQIAASFNPALYAAALALLIAAGLVFTERRA